MSRKASLCAVLLLASGLPLRAQSGASPDLALGLGLAGTLAPAAAGVVLWATGTEAPGAALTIASGIALGPAIGYWSAGTAGRGWKGLGLRAGLALISFVPAFAICGWDCTAGDDAYDLAWAVIATGAGLGAASAVYDLSGMTSNIQRHRAARSGWNIRITPALDGPTVSMIQVRAVLRS